VRLRPLRPRSAPAPSSMASAYVGGCPVHGRRFWKFAFQMKVGLFTSWLNHLAHLENTNNYNHAPNYTFDDMDLMS